MKTGSKSIVAAIVVGLMAIPVMSQAAIKSSKVDVNRIVITYEMEDLKSAEGRAALERQIRLAAEAVCTDVDYSKTRSIRDLVHQRSCFQEAVGSALAEIGSGTLQVTAL